MSKLGGYQYFCKKCGEGREGLLDESVDGLDLYGMPTYRFGYSWSCPKCGSHDIDSRPIYHGPAETRGE